MFRVYTGLALASSAALLYEIALTRVFAIAQGYHFGFLAISLALLGFGASGTALALRPPSPSNGGGVGEGVARLALLFSVSLLGSYLVANYLPFDAYRVAWEATQFVYLAAYLLSLALPFFLAGLLQGLPLTAWADRAAPLYAANLIGSGLGCLFALGALNGSSGPGAVVVAALLAACASFAFAAPARVGAWHAMLAPAIAVVAFTFLLWQTPAWLEIRLSPYKPLSQILNYPGTQLIYHGWNAFSRVDVVDSRSIRSAPGLSLAFAGPLPRQTGVVVDAENILALTARENLSATFFDALPVALPYRLRPAPRVLILEPGGGLDVLLALTRGASSIVAVEKNPLIEALVRTQVYHEPRVRVIVSSGRGYIARSTEPFDVIEVALSENFRAVSAGAFTLSENYLMTVEACQAYLARLAPNGLLVVHRWLQLPPTEELRAGALIITALKQMGVRDVAQHLIAIRSFSTMLLLAKREPFEAHELEQVKTFARERQFDLVYYPGIQRSEANRFNVLQRDAYFESFQELLANPTQFYAQYPYEVAPPTDDRPFFFHFFKWEQTPTVLALLGKTWQPFGGSGYLILLVLLGLTLILVLVLIALPLAVSRRRQRGAELSSAAGAPTSQGMAGYDAWGSMRLLIYFAGLGCGFLFVEMALIQRFILFLDQPVYAFTLVLFGLLIFSGLGSALAERAPWRAALAVLVLAIVVYLALLPEILAVFLGQDFALRVLIALLVLAPLGFLLGIPFPRGVRHLSQTAPHGIPLAWGVNGFTSVLSAILATLLALSWGFTLVFVGAAAAYALALAGLPRPAHQRHKDHTGDVLRDDLTVPLGDSP